MKPRDKVSLGKNFANLLKIEMNAQTLDPADVAEMVYGNRTMVSRVSDRLNARYARPGREVIGQYAAGLRISDETVRKLLEGRNFSGEENSSSNNPINRDIHSLPIDWVRGSEKPQVNKAMVSASLLLLNPLHSPVDFVGRNQELCDLQSWLNEDGCVSVHCIVGSAGTGKTRLALEICKESCSKNWSAGFLSTSHLPSVVELFRNNCFTAAQDTLIVLDYASHNHSSLGAWLDLLPAQFALQPGKLRILLLERFLGSGDGWWDTLYRPRSFTSQNRSSLFLSGLTPITKIEELEGDKYRRSIILNARKAALALEDSPTTEGDIDWDSTLVNESMSSEGFSNPLILSIVGVLSADLSLEKALSLNCFDAVQFLADRELERLDRLIPSTSSRAFKLLLSLNELVGGINVERIEEIATNFFDAIGENRNTLNDACVALLRYFGVSAKGTVPSTHSNTIGKISPDLIGEAMLITNLQAMFFSDIQKITSFLRASLDVDRDNAAAVLIRLLQDFAFFPDKSHDKAITTAQTLVEWFDELVRMNLPPNYMKAILSEIPEETIQFRGSATELARALTKRLFEIALESGKYHDILAACQAGKYLAARLLNAGNHEHAILTIDSCLAFTAEQRDSKDVDGAVTLVICELLLEKAMIEKRTGNRRKSVEVLEFAINMVRNFAGKSGTQTAHLLGQMLSEYAQVGDDIDARLSAYEESCSLLTENPELGAPKINEIKSSLSVNYSILLADLGRVDEAMEQAKMGFEGFKYLWKKQPDTYLGRYLTSFERIVTAHRDLGDLETAHKLSCDLCNFLDSEENSEVAELSMRRAKGNYLRGILEFESEMYEFARRHLEKALSLLEEDKNQIDTMRRSFQIVEYSRPLILTYSKLGETDAEINLMKKRIMCLEKCKSVAMDSSVRLSLSTQLADFTWRLLDIGKFSEALEQAQRAFFVIELLAQEGCSKELQHTILHSLYTLDSAIDFASKADQSLTANISAADFKRYSSALGVVELDFSKLPFAVIRSK